MAGDVGPVKVISNRYASHQGVKLCGVHHTVSQTQRLRYASQQGVKLCGVHHIASRTAHYGVKKKSLLVSDCFQTDNEEMVGDGWLWTQITWKKRFEVKCFDLLSLKFWLCNVMHIAELNFPNFVIKHLGKIEIEFDNILACLSGA